MPLTDALGPKLAFLEAQPVAPELYAFRPDNSATSEDPWFIVTAAQVTLLDLTGPFHETVDVYGARRKAAQSAVAVKARWWTPADQETYRHKTRPNLNAPARWVSRGCTPFDADMQNWERVKVDFATGLEVAA